MKLNPRSRKQQQQQQPAKLSLALLFICLLQCVVWSVGVAEESSQQYFLLQNEYLAKGHLNLVSAQELSNHCAHFQRLATLALVQQQEEWAAHLSLLQQRSLERDRTGSQAFSASSGKSKKKKGSGSSSNQDFLLKSLQHSGGTEKDGANLVIAAF